MSFVYRGLEATLHRHIITEEEVNAQLERLRQQSPRIAAVTDRPTQPGDEVVLDYAGFCDGEQFPGGTAEKQTLVLGSGSFIPGFEEQLLDKVPGQQVVVKVTFPEGYHAPNLAGKAAEFRCTIHEIRLKTPYAMDDDFAREVGGFETMEQMRAGMKKSLQDYTDQMGEQDLQDRLLRQAADSLNFTPTVSQMEQAMDEQMENLKAQLAHQGLTMEMYCQFLSTTEEKLREDSRGEAETSIRTQAAVEQIVYTEGLEASKEEIAQALAVICRQNNMTMEQLRPHYDAALEAAVVRSVLTAKAMQLIRDNAVITKVTDGK